MRKAFFGIVVVLLVVACEKKPTVLGDDEKPGAAKCSADADCEVIALSDCCHCCSDTEFHAVKKGAKYQRHCTGSCKVCVGPGSKDGKAATCGSNPKTTDFTAVCRAGTCAYAPRGSSPK